MYKDGGFITGAAWIGSACNLNGISINQDHLEYATIQTATHEIGHKLVLLNALIRTIELFSYRTNKIKTHL